MRLSNLFPGIVPLALALPLASCGLDHSGGTSTCSGREYDTSTHFCFKGELAPICQSGSDGKNGPPQKIGKALFIGNSLLFGNGTFGLNATTSDKDYFHYLDTAFRATNADYRGTRISAKQLENTKARSEREDMFQKDIAPFMDESLDLISIQLGDNLDEPEEIAGFDSFVFDFLRNTCSLAPNASVIWVGEWYSTEYKQKALRELTRKAGVRFVDISDLNTPRNRSKIGTVVTKDNVFEDSLKYTSYKAFDDSLQISFSVKGEKYKATIQAVKYWDDAEGKTIHWIGFQGITTNKEIASHPNDKAFLLIGERILNSVRDLFEGL